MLQQMLLKHRLYYYTVNHESFKAEKFHGFRGFLCVHETFLYENLSRMALFTYGFKRKYVGFRESFLRSSVYTTCHETFLPRNFHDIRYHMYSVLIHLLVYTIVHEIFIQNKLISSNI